MLTHLPLVPASLVQDEATLRALSIDLNDKFTGVQNSPGSRAVRAGATLPFR